MTMLEIRVPAEQEGTRSQVLRWLKKAGDAVRENEPIVELETDKVTVEVAAPGGGVLREIMKQESEELAPGEILGRIEVGVSAAEQARGMNVNQSAANQAKPDKSAALHIGGKRTIQGSTQLSPAVRRLLQERGLDASSVHGTGEGGRITVEDVLRHAPDAPIPSAPQAPASGRTGRLVPHSPIRARVAEHMVQSLLRTAPHVTSVFEADFTSVIAHRAKHRAEFEQRGVQLTFTAYFITAAVKAIRVVPEVNSRWSQTALEIFDSIDIGVATALEAGGLVVPVLAHAEMRDLFDVAQTLQDLVARAREGKLLPADVRGGTFTISNHGVSGSLLATPIVIHQPQSAILGIGKLEKRPVVIEEGGHERIVVRPKCYVTLTIDHRVMDGLQANQFLQAFVEALENSPGL
jgi:2-oxoglutarate dehydrogenase E2 component (dihydrolipoamide succinyltransferase)